MDLTTRGSEVEMTGYEVELASYQIRTLRDHQQFSDSDGCSVATSCTNGIILFSLQAFRPTMRGQSAKYSSQTPATADAVRSVPHSPRKVMAAGDAS